MSDYLLGGSDDWTDIVGEQTRGGTPAASTLTPVLGMDQGLMTELLGEVLQKSPAFRQYAERRAAASRPMIHKTPLQKARDWQIDFGPVSGAAGTTTTVTVAPQCLFRGEKVMATDTASPAGTGTRI